MGFVRYCDSLPVGITRISLSDPRHTSGLIRTVKRNREEESKKKEKRIRKKNIEEKEWKKIRKENCSFHVICIYHHCTKTYFCLMTWV